PAGGSPAVDGDAAPSRPCGYGCRHLPPARYTAVQCGDPRTPGGRPMVALNDRPLGETLDRRQRWLLLVSLMCAMFMGALDQTIMATAAPKIVANLGGFSLLSWIFTTYMLTSTVVGPLV